MINLHYCSLQHIVGGDVLQQGGRTTALVRQVIRDYRDTHLRLIQPDLKIILAAQGKPIAQHQPHFSFNHSHSQQHYALAYSEDVADLGVDIEDFSRTVKMHALAKRSFHRQEYQTWQALDYCRTYWFKVWTIKEAVLKAHGLGIALDLKSLNSHAHPTWDFGRVEHPLLGVFMYQCLYFTTSLVTVAYRQPSATQLQEIKIL